MIQVIEELEYKEVGSVNGIDVLALVGKLSNKVIGLRLTDVLARTTQDINLNELENMRKILDKMKSVNR